jgi:hypothetical protein
MTMTVVMASVALGAAAIGAATYSALRARKPGEARDSQWHRALSALVRARQGKADEFIRQRGLRLPRDAGRGNSSRSE